MSRVWKNGGEGKVLCGYAVRGVELGERVGFVRFRGILTVAGVGVAGVAGAFARDVRVVVFATFAGVVTAAWALIGDVLEVRVASFAALAWPMITVPANNIGTSMTKGRNSAIGSG